MQEARAGDVLHASPLLAVTEERCVIYIEFSNYPNLKLYDNLYPQQVCAKMAALPCQLSAHLEL
jgi:hypothetical protein